MISVGFISIPMTAPGTSSVRICIRFAPTSPVTIEIPVTLPSGRLKCLMRGGAPLNVVSTLDPTIGIVVVAAIAALTASVPPAPAITSTF